MSPKNECRARICRRLRSSGIDSDESILPWAGNRFLGSLKGLQIGALGAPGQYALFFGFDIKGKNAFGSLNAPTIYIDT